MNLEDIPFDQASIEKHIPAIEAYGARVDFDLAALPVDLNRDGMFDVQGIVYVASRFGHDCPNEADINGDTVIDILDLVMVAREFGTANKEWVSGIAIALEVYGI